jgi:hypothetical protein
MQCITKSGIAIPNGHPFGVAIPICRFCSDCDARVHVYVCGLQMTADQVPLNSVNPLVEIAEDGLIAIMTFEGRG